MATKADPRACAKAIDEILAQLDGEPGSLWPSPSDSVGGAELNVLKARVDALELALLEENADVPRGRAAKLNARLVVLEAAHVASNPPAHGDV